MKGVFWLLVATMVCASVVFWFVTSNDQTERPQADTRPAAVVRNEPPAAAPADGTIEPNTEQVSPEEPVPAPTATVSNIPEVIVDSFAASERAPLESWSSVDEFAGHFDVLTRSRDGIAIQEGVLLEAADVLVARGWAGNLALGLNLDDVMFSACGQIVGRTQTGGLRPDVAEAIHPNLMASGWRAEFLAGDLPSCADSNIRGWGIVPGPLARLAPLVGSFAYVSPGLTGLPPRLSAQQMVAASHYRKPEFVSLRVTAAKANLRNCGSTTCPVVGQIDAGRYTAHVASSGPEWSLIVFPDSAGWLFNELFEVTP